MKAAILILILLLFVCILPDNAQTKIIDSLKKNILTAKSADEKIQAIFLLCEERASLNTDTLFTYASTAKKIALQQNNQLNIVKATYYLSAVQMKSSLYDSVILTCDKNILWLRKTTSDKELLASFSFLKSGALIRSNRFKEALSFLYDMLHEGEKNADTLTQIKIKISIGWVNMEMAQNTEALSWFYKAMQTSNNPEYLKQYGILFSNIASTYNNLGNFDSAFFYVEKSIVSGRKYEQLTSLANALNIRADIYINTQNNPAAEKDLTEALSIRKQIGDPFYIVSDLAQLSNFYAIYHQQEKGIATAKEGLAIAEKNNLTAKLPLLYEALAENYKKKGDTKNYAMVLEKIISLKDSLYQKNSAQALAEMLSKYEVQKKESTIIKQKLDLTQKNYLFYGALLLIAFLITLAWLLFNNFRRKQKLAMQKAVFEEKILSSMAIKEAEENERKRIAADLHDNLGAYAASIASNLDQISLQQINESTAIPLQELRKNSQAIVAQLGDTIWALKKDALSLTAISDRLKIFIQRVALSYPQINMEVEETIDNDILLPPSQAFHLFSILQEAVINALKHSNCKNIIVHIASEQQWHINISDDGKGMDTMLIKSSVNGLANMQRRANEFNWELKWESMNTGTKIIISPTTN